MPRRRRVDAPGMWHHVMNRGSSRRTVFERREDVRYFLSLLAREVREGRIELHAYSILKNRYDLLLTSVTGELPQVMQRVQNLYARYFNRTRKRDGPLFRSRYRSWPVGSMRYRFVLVQSIDQSAPRDRLSTTAREYPYGSAVHYQSARRPRWLCTRWVGGRTVLSVSSSPQDEGAAAILLKRA